MKIKCKATCSPKHRTYGLAAGCLADVRCCSDDVCVVRSAGADNAALADSRRSSGQNMCFRSFFCPDHVSR